MKRLKKAFFTVILSIVLVLSGLITAYAGNIDLEAFERFTASVLSDITSLPDEELDFVAENYKSSYPGFASGLETWKSIKSETGDFLSLNSFDVTENNDGSYTVTADAAFTGTDCRVKIGVDASGYISSLDFELPVSKGQLMKDAASNLVVGMGTVFLVLIFLCFIISLFKYISVFEKKAADRKAAKKAAKASETEQAPAAAAASVVSVSAPAAAVSDDEIQAVIAAAIAAYEAEADCRIEKQPALNNGITVKSYRRK